MNLHVHFHLLVLDGVFGRDAQGRLVFHPAGAPSPEDLDAIVGRTARRTMNWLRKRGYLPRREAGECGKADGGGAPLAVDAVEQEDVKVRIELEVRRGPLHHDHGAALAIGRPLLLHPRLVEAQDGAHREPRHESQELLAVIGEARAPREGDVDHLVRQPLPLNVRELNAFLLKALDASPDDEVKLPLSNTTPPPKPPEEEGETEDRRAIAEPSKEELAACLAREGGNVSRAAKRLGLHRNVVYRLMKEYGIKRVDTAP